jgi:hypothetical protein
VSAAEVAPQKEVPTRNFFAPLRANMDTDSAGAEVTANEETVPGKSGRLPPVILTLQTNLIQLQKQLKNVVKGDFEFRSTRNGTRVVTKDMADFEAVKSHFTNHNLSYYSFFPKSQKPIKAVIRHLPPNTPAKDISEELENLGFEVISVKQMTTTRRSPSDETTTWNLPLFLITLPRTAKLQDIFKLPCLCHISIKVEAYRGQTGLTQSHNSQQFGHVWANSKQPPPVVCGAEAAAYTRSAQRKLTLLLLRRAATAGWRTETNHIPRTIGVADMPKKSCRERRHREHPKQPRIECSPQTSSLQVSPSWQHSEAAETSSSNHRKARFQRLHHARQ